MKSQEIRKSQEKLRKMTKVRKVHGEWGFLKKVRKNFKKSDFVSSNLLNSLYFKAFNSKKLLKIKIL